MQAHRRLSRVLSHMRAGASANAGLTAVARQRTSLSAAAAVRAAAANTTVRAASTAAGGADPWVAHVTNELAGIRAAGTFKRERVITSPQSNQIRVAESSKPVLNFCANNYLGLSNNPQLVAAAKDALDTHGFGLSSVRFICGTQDLHKKLEQKISDFHGTADTILYPSCFDANAGIFEQLLGAEDAVISDELNHASIIDGIRLCKAKRFRYKHNDMADLEAQLKAANAAGARFKLIATDGVFSMDGHIAPLKEVVALGKKYGAKVFIDECHATGFFGKTGRGTDEYMGVRGQIDIINSTLGKAMGGATGGYTTSKHPEFVQLLRQRARPYLFSNSLAPSVAAASLAAFDMLMKSTALRDKLEANTQLFRKRMAEAGFDLGGSKDHPIVPIMLGDAKLATDFADRMLSHGIYVIGFSYPVVPKGKARIRVQISAAHSTADVNACVDAFIATRKELLKK